MTVFVNIFRQDTFTRGNIAGNSSVATGWGTASDGVSGWTAMSGSGAATYSIASNEGHVTGVNNTDFDVYLGGTLKDTEVVVRLTSNDFGNDAGGIYLRFVDANNFYRCFLNGTQLAIDKKAGGTFTGGIGTASFTVTNGTFYFIRFHVLGNNLMARAWQSGSSEPGTWSINITDSSITSAGHVGLGANMALTSDTMDFDSFKAYYPQNTDVVSVRTKVRTQNTKTVVAARLLVRSLKTVSSAIRARVATLKTLSSNLRTPVRSKNTSSTKLRVPTRAIHTVTTVLRVITTTANTATKYAPLRVVTRSLKTVSTSLRTRVSTPINKIVQLLAVVRSQLTKTAAIRTNVRSLKSVSAKLRTPVKTKNTSTNLTRVVVRSKITPLVVLRVIVFSATLASKSAALRLRLRSQKTATAHLRIIVYAVLNQMLYDDVQTQYAAIRAYPTLVAKIAMMAKVYFPPQNFTSDTLIPGEIDILLTGETWSQLHELKTINDVNNFISEYA